MAEDLTQRLADARADLRAFRTLGRKGTPEYAAEAARLEAIVAERQADWQQQNGGR